MLPTPSVHEFGSFRLDGVERLLLKAGQPVSLTPKAFNLLVYLVEHHGQLVAKKDLLSAVWPDTFVEEANLTYTISALRKALGDSQDGERYIQTVPTRGYRFVAPVARHERPPIPSIAEARPAAHVGGRWKNTALLSAALASILLAMLVVLPPFISANSGGASRAWCLRCRVTLRRSRSGTFRHLTDGTRWSFSVQATADDWCSGAVSSTLSRFTRLREPSSAAAHRIHSGRPTDASSRSFLADSSRRSLQTVAHLKRSRPLRTRRVAVGDPVERSFSAPRSVPCTASRLPEGRRPRCAS